MSAIINSQSTLHQGRVFNLINENYTLENGVTTDMDFVQHPGAAAMVPMLNQTEVVLIKQYRHAIREFIWEIPAGTLDPEESAINCAKRELGKALQMILNGEIQDGKTISGLFLAFNWLKKNRPTYKFKE